MLHAALLFSLTSIALTGRLAHRVISTPSRPARPGRRDGRAHRFDKPSSHPLWGKTVFRTAFNKTVEEKLGKIDVLASKVESLALDVDLLKLKVMPNNDKESKTFAKSGLALDTAKPFLITAGLRCMFTLLR